MSHVTSFFLDTNVFDSQQYNFQSTALTKLAEAARKLQLPLLVPAPTEDEVLRHISERTEQALNAVVEAKKKNYVLSRWRTLDDTALQNEAKQVQQQIRREWRNYLRHLNAIKLNYDGISIQEVMTWYNRKHAPFSQTKPKEFPDAFTLAILAQFAEKLNQHIAVVSSDIDFKMSCRRYSRLVYYKSPAALTEKLLNSEDVQDVKMALVMFMEIIESAILSDAANIEFVHPKPIYYVADSKVLEAKVQALNVVAIGSEDATIAFEVDLKVSSLISWATHYNDDFVTHEKRQVETLQATVSAKVETQNVVTVIGVWFDNYTIELKKTPRLQLL